MSEEKRCISIDVVYWNKDGSFGEKERIEEEDIHACYEKVYTALVEHGFDRAVCSVSWGEPCDAGTLYHDGSIKYESFRGTHPGSFPVMQEG